jgi:esterase
VSTTLDPERQLSHLRLAAERNELAIREIVLPESHHVLAGDIRLHYLDWDGASDRDILFLHGGGLNAHTWDMVCLGLREEYRCIAVDQRGHGDSEWSAGMDYTTEAHVRDIEQFADAIGLERFVLVGMSLGGLNSILYAARHSDRLAGLVLVDVGPELRTEGTSKISSFIGQPAELPSIEDFVERAMQFNPRRNPDLLRTSLLHNLRRLPDGNWTWKYDRRHHGRFDRKAMDAARLKLAERLPEIRCPTLVVRGEHSDVFWDEDAEKLVSQLPDARWVTVPNAGHTVQGDNPGDLTIALREFLDPLKA